MSLVKKKIAIFCGAKFPNVSEDELSELKASISWIAQEASHQFDLVYGGGQVGLMGIVADAFLHSEAHVTGVIPTYMNSIEIQHTEIDETIEVVDLHERKAKMEALADLFLILPGGIGTVDELFEVFTLRILERHQKPIFIWNWKGLYNELFQFIDRGINMGFIDPRIRNHCFIHDSEKNLLKVLLQDPSALDS